MPWARRGERCRWRHGAIAALPIVLCAFGSSAGQATSCEDLAALTLPDITIVSASTIPAGGFAPPGERTREEPLPESNEIDGG